MKNNPLVLLVLLIPSFSTAQLYKFKAVECVITRYGGKELKPHIHEPCDSIDIIFDTQIDTFLIKTEKRQSFKLKNDPSGYLETDSTVTARFIATDQEGSNCFVISVFAKREGSKHAGFFIIAYQDKTYLYYVDFNK